MKEDDPQHERRLTTCCQVVDCLLAIYYSHDVIAEDEAEITKFKQREQMFAVGYSEIPWEKALRCGCFYYESRVKGVFIERLHKSIRFSMST